MNDMTTCPCGVPRMSELGYLTRDEIVSLYMSIAGFQCSQLCDVRLTSLNTTTNLYAGSLACLCSNCWSQRQLPVS